jgi:ABC-2 type transport system permease protein
MQNLRYDANNIVHLKILITRGLSFQGGSGQYLLLVVPVLISVLVFRYMQKSRSASLYHSLPITRATLYFSSVLSAVILFVLPLILVTSIMFLFSWFSPLSAFYTPALIFTWFGYSLLFGILFISMSVFVGMFTGNSIAQLAFIYILNALPMFLVEFVRINLKKLLFGFDTYSNVSFYDNMPMIMLFKIGYSDYQALITVVYIFVAIALFAGGLLAFKIRKPETAGDIITFRPIRPVFIYGVTVCATLLGGAYFLSMSDNVSFPFILFGYFISSILSYVVVQMLTNRSIKILHTYKGYIGYALVLLILMLGVKFDVIGYINKVPAANDIKEVYIGYNIYWWESKDRTDLNITDDRDESGIYTEPENIENITKLHKLILDKRSSNGSSEYIAYKLKNGEKIIRYYCIDTDQYASALIPVYESAEYKKSRFPILYQDVNNIKYVEMGDNRTQKTPYVLSEKDKLKAFKAAISEDIKNLQYKDISDNFERTIYMDIVNTQNKRVSYALRSNYVKTLAWLKQQGIYDKIILQANDIQSITINKVDFSSNKANSDPRTIEIEDKDIISELLNISIDSSRVKDNINYTVFFNQSNRGSYPANLYIDYDKVSEKLKGYLDKLK